MADYPFWSEAITNGLVDLFTAKMSDFTPDLLNVWADNDWTTQTPIEDLGALAPCVVIELVSADYEPQTGFGNMLQKLQFRANHFWPLEGAHKSSFQRSIDLMGSILSAGANFNEVAQLQSAVGNRLVECVVSGATNNRALIESGIGWAVVDFSVTTLSN